jgi:tetratricopeptide (TPR) repeat protein
VLAGFVGRIRAWAIALIGLASLAYGSQALADAPWLKTETPRFILYSNGSEQTLRDYAVRLELLDATFWEVYGLARPPPPPRKLPIYLVTDMSMLRLVSPSLSQSAAGFYSAGADEVFAMGLARRGNDYVLLHEYVHHLMMQNFPFGYPAWFIEGYAEYFMETTVNESTIKVGLATGRAQGLALEQWLPMQDLLTKRVSEIPVSKGSTFYAQAWLLTHYLVSDPTRAKQLQTYLTAVGQGQKSVEAIEASTGIPTDAWQRRLMTYLTGQMPYVQFKRTQFPKTEVEIVRLSPATSELLLDDLHVRSGVAPELRGGLLAKMRGEAAKYPEDVFARTALARAEVALGDGAAAVPILKRLLADNPRDVEALALEAQRLMALGDKTPARRADLYNQAGSILAMAFKLDPKRYQTLFEFAHSRSGEPNYPSDNTLTALLSALKLAPQVGEIRLEAAEGLMRRSRGREAALLLAPLANNPHDSGLAKRAQDLLKQIADAKTP